MSISAKLWVPGDVWVNWMPPVPERILVSLPVAAFLTNQGALTEMLFAPTPCDIHYWQLIDADGRIVQAEEPEICVGTIVNRPLNPAETIRGDNVLPLNGTLLRDGQRYTVRYKFWGCESEDGFTAHVVQ